MATHVPQDPDEIPHRSREQHKQERFINAHRTRDNCDYGEYDSGEIYRYSADCLR